MSVQAGIWNFDGRPVDRTLLERCSRHLAKYGPDGESTFFDGTIAMLYRPFRTTSDSRLERQPQMSGAGNIITWDGRLDNREALAAELTDRPSMMMTDVDVVAAAFDHWGSECFEKFIGDWAFTGWDPKERTLTLAIDYMAIKHLHYHLKRDGITWSTDLEVLVLESGEQLDLDDEYIAGYLASNPSPGRTPYLQIRSVEPGHLVRIHAGQAVSCAHFKFNPKRKLCYKTDAEYEEHFRHVFRQAVRRRLHSDAPVLADLSGGLDSSAIVCVADDIIGSEGADTPRLDTCSFYDLDEPNGDDLRYFPIVEIKRGRIGHHIDITGYQMSILPATNSFSVIPGRLGASRELDLERSRIWQEGRYRTRLSGIGGDEMLGGVPEPRPELADLIVRMRPLQFLRQATAWSLVKRRPLIQLAVGSVNLLLPPAVKVAVTKESKTPPWVNPFFANRFNLARRQLGPLERYGFWLPSRQECARTAVALARRMAKQASYGPILEEIRYPYLDQNLVEFLISIPRTQIIRPGERRSLMRRALAGLLPNEILSRQTKATAARGPIVALANVWEQLDKLLSVTRDDLPGFVDNIALRQALTAAKTGYVPQLVKLLEALSLQLWLENATRHGLFKQALFGGSGHISGVANSKQQPSGATP